MNHGITRFLRQEQEATGSGIILDRRLTGSGKRQKLALLYRETLSCRDCQLADTRNRVVFGAGNAESDLVLIGEAPGREEDSMGLPFVGRAGGLLDSVLGEFDIDRNQDCFITNILKCRPPGNRDPHPEEIDSCMTRLENQLAILEPRFIITLGRIASGILFGRMEAISRIRGRLFSYGNIPFVPVYHPAAILRNRNLAEDFRADLRFAITLYRKFSSGFTWGPAARRINKTKK